MPQKTFNYAYRANLHDIDAAGVMFFASYFRQAHDAYETFMAEIGFSLPQLIRQRILLPLVHSEADFLQPVRHGEPLDIELQLQQIGHSSFTIGYVFRNSQGAEAAHLRTTHVMLNPENQQPTALPGPLRDALSTYSV